MAQRGHSVAGEILKVREDRWELPASLILETHLSGRWRLRSREGTDLSPAHTAVRNGRARPKTQVSSPRPVGLLLCLQRFHTRVFEVEGESAWPTTTRES